MAKQIEGASELFLSCARSEVLDKGESPYIFNILPLVFSLDFGYYFLY